MRFDIITIFPEAFSYLKSSMLKRAQERRLIGVNIRNLRDFTTDKHKTVDGKPYGGGPGMVLKIEPLARAITMILKIKNQPSSRARVVKKSKIKNKVKIILFSAAGKQFTQTMARDFAKKYSHIVMVAGHYEGVDERVKKVIQDSGFMIQEVSIGPYILTGGELPAMVVIDAVSRHIPGVLGKEESLEEKRGFFGVPVYTRPEVFIMRGKKYRAPKVLLSGNHKRIREWRSKAASKKHGAL